MKQTSDKDGYPQLVLQRNGGGGITRRTHIWVAEAFIPNPNNLPQINHLNGIKSDNRVENLEWTTQSLNTIHAYETGLNSNIGANHRAAKKYVVKRGGEVLSYFDNTFQLEESLKTDRGQIISALSSEELFYGELNIEEISQIPKTNKLNMELVSSTVDHQRVFEPFKVTNLETGEIQYFKSRSDCARNLPINRRTLSGRGEHTLRGYHYLRITKWEYLTR